MLPDGWLKAFGIQMCEEISAVLPPQDGFGEYERYRILEVKEKYGQLRWFDAGEGSTEARKIVSKYERLSEHTYVECGKPATRMSTHWICPYCNDCGPEYEKYVEIECGR